MPVTSAAVPEPVRAYLDELERVSCGLARHERQDLRARVWAEVAEAVGSDPTPERVEVALRRLGPPAVLAGTGEGEYPLRDPVVVHLLGSSLLTFGIGGVAGLVRAWRSPSWPRSDALVATAVVLVCGAALPLSAPVNPLAGALLGGLGVGALFAACVLGVRMLAARRRARRSRPACPSTGAARRIPPQGEVEPPPAGGVAPPPDDQNRGSVEVWRPTTAPVDSKESG